jgi:hypothetical protein
MFGIYQVSTPRYSADAFPERTLQESAGKMSIWPPMSFPAAFFAHLAFLALRLREYLGADYFASDHCLDTWDDRAFAIVFPVLSAAFAAFCVWLTLRFINRRERWAKWTLASVAVLTLYVASFGPARAAYVHRLVPEWTYPIMGFHYPIIWAQPRLPGWIWRPYESYTWKWCEWLEPRRGRN